MRQTGENLLVQSGLAPNVSTSAAPLATGATRAGQGRAYFLLLAAAMTLLFAISWPVERSFDLWVFKDRGSLLKLDYMLADNLRLGVDTFYSYGLLPVLLQHWLFAVFGRGPWPLIGTHFVYILLSAAGWTLIAQRLPRPTLALVCLILLTPILVWVNPNFPYLLVQLSLLFSLALLLEERYSAAVAVSAIGCWSVPTVTLLASGLLLIAALFAWGSRSDRSARSLVRMVAPGAIAYLGLGAVLAIFFGWRSVLATAMPFQGMAEYKTIHYGMFTTLKIFLHPDDVLHGSYLRYYICDRATWWMFSTALLFALAIYSIVRMLADRRIVAGLLIVTICAIVQGAFVFLAYGSSTQHIIFDPIVVAGVLIGLALLPLGRLRPVLLAVFMVLGVLSHINQTAYTYSLWKRTHPSAQSANFYAPADYVAKWSDILALSQTHRTTMLSYGTGMQHYFPRIETPDIWTVQLGELTGDDKQRLMASLRHAEVIAEDLTGPTELFETDPDIKRELGGMCLIDSNEWFMVWVRSPVMSPGSACRSAASSS
jgi:hypothetical protein